MSYVETILSAENSLPPKQRKSNTVYHAVKRAILLRRLEPGQALLEQQIAATMGCSQGTVREALLRLEQDGLVSRRGYRGTAVSTTSLEEAAQMARIRISLETESARRAAESCTKADLARFDAIIARIGEAEARHDGYSLSELDREFHLAIFQQARLSTLEPILTRCALHVHRYTFGNGPIGVTPDNRVGLPSSMEQHRVVRDALATRDPALAARAMRDHIETILGYWSSDLLRMVRGEPIASR
ncbi:MAG TPA: GntR family transcriptional regulator [Dongiaceae bacterium]|nr:GntR family transcriptional regulator [Dongiaceae bacterium]